eukprot:jgi/Bigna1/66962/fgenesh1_pg.2_\
MRFSKKPGLQSLAGMLEEALRWMVPSLALPEVWARRDRERCRGPSFPTKRQHLRPWGQRAPRRLRRRGGRLLLNQREQSPQRAKAAIPGALQGGRAVKRQSSRCQWSKLFEGRGLARSERAAHRFASNKQLLVALESNNHEHTLHILLIVPIMKHLFNSSYHFVYLDVGCNEAEEARYVLKEFNHTTIVALEMQQDVYHKCASLGAKDIRFPDSQLRPYDGDDNDSFSLLLDRSSFHFTLLHRLRVDQDGYILGNAGSTIFLSAREKARGVQFDTLDNVYKSHLQGRFSHIDLLKIDAEGWDGWILRNGSRELVTKNIVRHIIFE